MIYVILGIATLFSFIPFWHIIACSFSASEDVVNTPFLLFPKHFTLDTMRYVFSSKNIVGALFNSVLITAVGTVLSLSMTALMAYPLSRKNLRFRNQIMFILVLTMVFHPGMIPNFLNVKSFGLYNSRWALILPGMIGTYNLVLVRNFYESLPESMIESAKIDGASDWKIFTKMVIPPVQTDLCYRGFVLRGRLLEQLCGCNPIFGQEQVVADSGLVAQYRSDGAAGSWCRGRFCR